MKIYSSTLPSPKIKHHQPFNLLLIFVMTGLIIGVKQPKSNLPSDVNWNIATKLDEFDV